jgi:hypothetical protein
VRRSLSPLCGAPPPLPLSLHNRQAGWCLSLSLSRRGSGLEPTTIGGSGHQPSTGGGRGVDPMTSSGGGADPARRSPNPVGLVRGCGGGWRQIWRGQQLLLDPGSSNSAGAAARGLDPGPVWAVVFFPFLFILFYFIFGGGQSNLLR